MSGQNLSWLFGEFDRHHLEATGLEPLLLLVLLHLSVGLVSPIGLTSSEHQLLFVRVQL